MVESAKFGDEDEMEALYFLHGWSFAAIFGCELGRSHHVKCPKRIWGPYSELSLVHWGFCKLLDPISTV